MRLVPNASLVLLGGYGQRQAPVGRRRTASGRNGGRLAAIRVWPWESGIPFTPLYVDSGKDEDTGPCRPNVVEKAGSGRHAEFTLPIRV